ncbi:MAG: hypothetical protein ABGZ17_00080, partial [Planctomycetaceae bacterium]
SQAEATGMPVLNQIQPLLPSRDVPASIDFDVGRLGYSLGFQDAERPTYAGVRRDGVELHLKHRTSYFYRGRHTPIRIIGVAVRRSTA